MPQVIVKAALADFYYALSTNAGRRPIIRKGCAPAADLMTKTSQEFHRRNPQTLAVTLSTKPGEHARKLENFYRRVCHVRLAKEGNEQRGGFIVLDGELLGFHHVDAGHGEWMLREAISLGADRLDCLDVPHLIDLYQRHGFKEILREFNHVRGLPDVVWMRRDAHAALEGTVPLGT